MFRTLTQEEIEELQHELVPNGVPVRFMYGGRSVDIVTGYKVPKGTNIMNQIVYWNFTRETALRVARITGTRAAFS